MVHVNRRVAVHVTQASQAVHVHHVLPIIMCTRHVHYVPLQVNVVDVAHVAAMVNVSVRHYTQV
jgi:hypothetical protein